MQFKNFKRDMGFQIGDFWRGYKRQEADFERQLSYQSQDFYRSRKLQFRDFNISLQRQAQDAAKTIYDPFSRVMAQYTEGGQSVVQNLEDQNRRITQQYANLQKLRRLGVSQQVISALALNDPNNAQQLDRLVQDLMSDPNLIKQINNAIKNRLKGTKRLTQSSFNDQYTREIADFKRGMADSATEFNIQRQRAVDQQSIQMGRMVADFNMNMQRSQKVLADSFTQITGSIGSNLTTAIATAGAALGPYAQKVIKVFNDFAKANPELFGPGGLLNYIASGGVSDATAGGPSGEHSNPKGKAAGTSSVRSGGGHGNTTITTVNNYNVASITTTDPNKMAQQLANKARLAKLARAG
jgi:hypothetical protein